MINLIMGNNSAQWITNAILCMTFNFVGDESALPLTACRIFDFYGDSEHFVNY